MFFSRAQTRAIAVRRIRTSSSKEKGVIMDQTEPLVCNETGRPIIGEFFVATRENDSRNFVHLSKEAVQGIPADLREQGGKTYATGGFEIYRATIGKNGYANYSVDREDGQFLFSVSAATALELLPKTQECFPCKEQHFVGEERGRPVDMTVIPLT